MRSVLDQWMKEQGDQMKIYGKPTLLDAPGAIKDERPKTSSTNSDAND
jgi:hypothetical protein